VGQISVRKQSLNTEELLMVASNHDWCAQIHVHRARVSPALHEKCSHSNMVLSGSEVKWSELTIVSDLDVGSRL
jgi:hypothetical protein